MAAEPDRWPARRHRSVTCRGDRASRRRPRAVDTQRQVIGAGQQPRRRGDGGGPGLRLFPPREREGVDAWTERPAAPPSRSCLGLDGGRQYAMVSADGDQGVSLDRALRHSSVRGSGDDFRRNGGAAPSQLDTDFDAFRTPAGRWPWACRTTLSLVPNTYVGDSQRGIDAELRLPHRTFHRNNGVFAGVHTAPNSTLIDEATWAARRDDWLPNAADRAFV